MSRFAGSLRVALATVVALLAVATFAGFLDWLSWVFEPLGFFRLQYAGVLMLAALVALLARQFRLAAVAVVVGAVNVAAIAPWHGAGNPPVPSGSPVLRIVSFNLDAANHHYDALAPLLTRLDPDIVGLSELTPSWAHAAAGASARVRPRRLEPELGVYGLGLLSAHRPQTVSVERFPASGGPIALIARFAVNGRTLTFVLVHVHTSFAGSVHARELRALADARPQLGRRLAICGDFNTVPWSAQLGEFAESTDLRDAYAGSWPAYSWPSWSRLLRVPLDHCLVSDGVSVRYRGFGPSSGSDHFPLIVDVALVPFRS